MGIQAFLLLDFLPEWALVGNRAFVLLGVDKSFNKWGIQSADIIMKFHSYILNVGRIKLKLLYVTDHGSK